MLGLLAGSASSHAAGGLAERAHGVAQLPVAQVWRRAEPQELAARIGVDAALAESADERSRARAAQREEAAERRERETPIARDPERIEIERVELRGEKPHLMLADRAQQGRSEGALREEVEDFHGPVVRDGIVRRAREAERTVRVGDAGSGPGFEGAHLREPARDDRPQLAVRRPAQEAAALAELTVL